MVIATIIRIRDRCRAKGIFILTRAVMAHLYFLNKFSKAVRASFGRNVAGVEVSFSRVTRISYSSQLLRASFLAMRSFTGCMHSSRLPGSKYVHCLHE